MKLSMPMMGDEDAVDQADGGSKQQNDTEREFAELQHGGKKRDVRQHQAFDQPRKDAACGAWIPTDELVEILYVPRIGELIEARQNELDA